MSILNSSSNVCEVAFHGSTKGQLPKENHLVETFGFEAEMESLEIRTFEWHQRSNEFVRTAHKDRLDCTHARTFSANSLP